MAAIAQRRRVLGNRSGRAGRGGAGRWPALHAAPAAARLSPLRKALCASNVLWGAASRGRQRRCKQAGAAADAAGAAVPRENDGALHHGRQADERAQTVARAARAAPWQHAGQCPACCPCKPRPAPPRCRVPAAAPPAALPAPQGPPTCSASCTMVLNCDSSPSSRITATMLIALCAPNTCGVGGRRGRGAGTSRGHQRAGPAAGCPLRGAQGAACLQVPPGRRARATQACPAHLADAAAAQRKHHGHVALLRLHQDALQAGRAQTGQPTQAQQ